MIFLLMALIVFVAILLVGYPLVNARQYQFESAVHGDERFESLMTARSLALDAIRDLEFDHATGKLSDDDYRQMRARYDLRAAEVLDKIDAATAAPKKSGRAAEGETNRKQKVCSRCKSAVQATDRFCPTCGARVD